jgi:signal transduction histidine kinase
MEGFSGTELLARIGASSPDSHVVVRVPVDDIARASSCLAQGAHGVVATDDDAGAVMAAIRAVGEGGAALSPRIARSIGDALLGSLDAAERLGADLEELRHSVAQGTSAKADFLSNISHELRTPVTVAKGIAYVLNNPSIGEDERAEFSATPVLDRLMGPWTGSSMSEHGAHVRFGLPTWISPPPSTEPSRRHGSSTRRSASRRR